MRTYRVTFFKKVPGTAEVYGGKVFVGNLDQYRPDEMPPLSMDELKRAGIY